MPRTLSSSEYKELGKRYYSQKKFQNALDAFTEAIEASPNPDVSLFDYRAATWEKLENFKAALADGRLMIKAGKTDPRGYLRTAQILQKMDQLDVALSIYQYGLRNVPVSTNPHLKLLQAAHDKLNRQLSPPTAVDPFSQLPIEIVEMIIGYLRFYEIVNCLRVSKQWKAFITSAPSLWSNLDFFRSSRQPVVKPQFVRSCIKYSQYKIHTARIHKYSDRSGLRGLATTCKSLTNLEFLQTEFGGDSIIETVMMARNLKVLKLSAAVDLSLDQISMILKHRPTLAHLQADHVKEPRILTDWQVDLPNLQIFNLSVHKDVAVSGASTLEYLNCAALISKAPNIKELRLSRFNKGLAQIIDFSPLIGLEVLELKHCPLRAAPALPPSIRELVLIDITQNPTTFTGFVFTSNLPVLEKLHLSGLTFDLLEVDRLLDGIDDVDQVTQYTKLKMLGLTGVYTGFWPDGRVQQTQLVAHSRLTDIEELVLNLNTDIVIDDVIAKLLSGKPCSLRYISGVSELTQLETFKKLRRLDLSTTWVTGVGIRAIVTALKGQLKWLDVSGCRHLSADAVEWARSQGVDVIYRGELALATSSRDMRRVRYGD